MPTVYLALIIPIVVTGIFYFFRKSEFVWWEFFIPIVAVLIAVIISKVVIDHQSVRFTEWWGSSVTAVYEEEPYNYWQSETCSRSVACGTDSDGNTIYCTEYYDCSHQVDVEPSWWAETDLKEKLNITEKQYDELVIQFQTGKSIINSHKNYAPRDRAVGSQETKFEGKRVGDVSYVYQTIWDGQDETRKAYVSQHAYVNKVKASDLSIFNMKIVDEELADSMGLFKYPQYEDGGLFTLTCGLEYPTILGENISKETQEKFRRLNGKFGPTNEMRLWILVFEDKPMSIADYQENYWVKGNMNELVICIGKKEDKIQWSKAFSWAHSTELTAAVQNEVMNLYVYEDSVIQNYSTIIPTTKNIKDNVSGDVGEKLPDVLPVSQQANTINKVKSAYPMLTEKTWDDLYNYLDQNLNQFKRRSFEEFDYLTVEPSIGAKIFIYVFALLIAVGINLIVINNEIK